MLTNKEENFFQIVEIDSITEDSVYNCIDITVEEDESFVLANGIVSHNSAVGSILQKRDPKTEGAYALKGKIKNCKNIGDLSDNKEILELMQILGLDPTVKNTNVTGYKKIVIATDPDCLEENTLVSTNRGNIKIKDIVPGDLVNTHLGERKVLNSTEKIDDSYIEISIRGNKFICTRDHKFPVVRDGNLIIIKANELLNSDFLLIKNLI